MILATVVACAWTIKIALDNPVEMDTFYMEKYQKVDQNINEIMELQEKFNAKYDLRYSTESFVMGKNSFSIKLLDKENGKEIENAKVTLLLSRQKQIKTTKR